MGTDMVTFKSTNPFLQFVATFLSMLTVFSMMIGIYNPSKAEFVPPTVQQAEVYQGETLDIIENDGTDYVIVKAADAIPAENMAAEKLQGFLAQISGVTVPIVADSAAPQGKEIVVGNTNRFDLASLADGMEENADLGTDGFIVKTVDEKLILGGGKTRGTLYSVYDFLEKYMGCRWLSKDFHVIPEQDAVKIPIEINELEIPKFIYRQGTTVYYQTAVDTDYSIANRVNGKGMIPNSTDAAEYGGVMFWPVGHSAQAIVPPHKYLESNPDYFAQNADEDGGGVMYCPNGENNPCLTNPDVIGLYKDYALNIMRNDPKTEGIAMGLNDSGTICQCPNCRAVHAQQSEPLAGQTATLMLALKAVCDALYAEADELEAAGRTEDAKGYRSVTINAFAYGTATYPPDPDFIQMPPNVTIHFAPGNMCYLHKPGECDYWENIYYFDEVLKGWGQVVQRIAIFEYPLSYNQPGAVYPIWGVLQDYMQMYYENGVVGLTSCNATVQDLNMYVMLGYMYNRLLWDPYLDMDALLADFISHYYGDGWQYVKEYVRFAPENAGKTIAGATFHNSSMNGHTQIGALSLTKNEIKYVDGLWEKAKEMAATKAQLDNVRRAELSWRMWKSDNFRGEFWFFDIRRSRMEENKKLYDDCWELLYWEQKFTDFFGNERDFKGIWHNTIDWWVTPDEFYDLQLYILYPRSWSWKQLGVRHEGLYDNFWDLIYNSFLV